MKTNTILIFLLLFLVGKVTAQETELEEEETFDMTHVAGKFSIDIDQDYFIDWIPNANHDRNYSQGTAFGYTKYRLEESPLFLPLNIFDQLVQKFGNSLFNFDERVELPATISMGVSAFTPLDIADSLNPVIGDRPFANVAFLTTQKNRFNKQSKMISTTSFSYGIIGSNIANVFQSKAHTVITGRPTNIGWQYQISNGGHPAFLFTHAAQKAFLEKKSSDGKKYNFQSLVGYKFNLGWYTGIAATTSFKVGGFRYGVNQENRNPLSVSDKIFSVGNLTEKSIKKFDSETSFKTKKEKPANAKKCYDWFFFLNISPRLTAYNSLILGQPRVTSVYTLPKENYNPFILDSEIGFFISKINYVEDLPIPLRSCDLLLSINARTAEILSKDVTVKNEFTRAHAWGKVVVRFPLF